MRSFLVRNLPKAREKPSTGLLLPSDKYRCQGARQDSWEHGENGRGRDRERRAQAGPPRTGLCPWGDRAGIITLHGNSATN